MRTGRYRVPEELSESLKSLCKATKEYPYRHYGDKEDHSYQASVNRALEFLESKRLDIKAALAVFCAVRYLTQKNLDEAWRSAFTQLDSWLKKRGLNTFRDCHFLEVGDEPHFVELSRAAEFSHRKDPEKFPSLKTVEEIWDKIKLAAANQHNSQDLEKLEAIADREVWILLWDLNLSGKTIAKEISRLAKCKWMLAPYSRQYIHVLCQVSTQAGTVKIKEKLKSLGLKGKVFSGSLLTEHDRVETTSLFSERVRKQVRLLCKKFYHSVMNGAEEQPWLTDVCPLGYDNGGWLLVTQVNCPNNSLPLLWFAPPNPEAADSPNSYKPPFPRIPSTLSHKSLAPYDLDSLTLSAERWFKERIRSLIIHQVKEPSYDDRRYLSRMQAGPKRWERTNHSDFKIRLQEVPRDEFDEIRNAIKRHYNKGHINVKEISVIERIAEDTGSANFKITRSKGSPILFRVNKRITDLESIKRIHGLARYFYDYENHSILPNSNDRECLKPLDPKTEFPRDCPKISGKEEGGYLAAYKYAEADSHFTGHTLDELQSVAAEFARFQVALGKLRNSRPEISLELPPKSAGALNYYGSNPAKRYCVIRAEILRRKPTFNWYDIPYQIMRNSMKLLNRAADRLKDGRHLLKPGSPDDATAAYLDLHPHNILVKDKKCVLIYDFESCYLQPNQEASLAFAVHRFTREWFIKDPDIRGYPTPDNIKTATSAFLTSYRQAGGLVPGDFITRFPLLILWANFMKLLSIYDKLSGHRGDKSGRTPRTLVSELRKFVTYIQEAEAYESVHG